jgi:hypothetical protein
VLFVREKRRVRSFKRKRGGQRERSDRKTSRGVVVVSFCLFVRTHPDRPQVVRVSPAAQSQRRQPCAPLTASRPRLRQKRTCLFSLQLFRYVCPEPVLATRKRIVRHRKKEVFFARKMIVFAPMSKSTPCSSSPFGAVHHPSSPAAPAAAAAAVTVSETVVLVEILSVEFLSALLFAAGSPSVAPGGGSQRISARKRHPHFEVSLCLSRACLGKMMHFSATCGMAQKLNMPRFLTCWRGALVEELCACEKRHSFLNFSYVCPEPVLVKGCILYINGIAKSGVFLTLEIALCTNRWKRSAPCVFQLPHGCPEPVLANHDRVWSDSLPHSNSKKKKGLSFFAFLGPLIGRLPPSRPAGSTLQENVPFWEFSLCLSRACLGKTIAFIYKWRKKRRFLTCTLTRLQKTETKSSFSFALFQCTHVPSLSRQIFGFFRAQNGAKQSSFFFSAPLRPLTRASLRRAQSGRQVSPRNRRRFWLVPQPSPSPVR